MRLPHLTLVWSPRRLSAGWRLGLWGEYRRSGGGPWALAVSVRGALLWGGALGLAVFLLAAGALLQFRLNALPFNSITYADLVLPWRWPQLSARRGQDHIAAGLEFLRQKKGREAKNYLEAGLRRYPQSTKARLVLASFALAQNDRAKAETLLRDGLSYGWPGRDYVAQLFALAAQGENYPLLIAAAETALAQLKDRPLLAEDRRWVVRQKLSALIAAGRADEAARVAVAEGESQGPVMREFHALALLKAGPPAAAVDFLTAWRAAARAPEEVAQTRRLLVRALREAGRPDEMNRVLEELRDADPARPEPYIYGTVQRLLANRREDAEKSYNAFLLRFGSKLASLVQLAEPLGEIGEEPLLTRLLAVSRDQRLPLLSLQRALAVAQMKNGHWADTRATLAAIRPALPPDDATGAFWLEWMSLTAAAAASPAQDTQEALANFARPHPYPLHLRLYLDTLDVLRRAGRAETAAQVFAFARGAYPASPSLGDQADAVAAGLARARDDAARLAVASLPTLPAVVAPEVDFFRALGDPLTNPDPAAALAQIRAARSARPAPAWLATRDEELRRAEVALAARLSDAPALAATAGLWLTGDASRLNAAVALARQLHDAGFAAEAGQLLDAVLRKSPSFPSAARLLAEWRPAGTPLTPVSVTPPAAAGVANEAGFFQTLGDPLTNPDPAAALALLRGARAARPAPGWLAARDADLRRAEVALTARLGDIPALTVAARQWLTTDPARANAATALARQLHDAGRPAEAAALADEIVRKIPAFSPVTRLRAEWAAPPPAGK